MTLKAYADLARPFTLLMPMLGFFSGAVTGEDAELHAQRDQQEREPRRRER